MSLLFTNSNVFVQDTLMSQTQTDRQTTYRSITTLCTKVHRAVKIIW